MSYDFSKMSAGHIYRSPETPCISQSPGLPFIRPSVVSTWNGSLILWATMGMGFLRARTESGASARSLMLVVPRLILPLPDLRTIIGWFLQNVRANSLRELRISLIRYDQHVDRSRR